MPKFEESTVYNYFSTCDIVNIASDAKILAGLSKFLDLT